MSRPASTNPLEPLLPFFWPIIFGGICAAALSLRYHVAHADFSALVVALIVGAAVLGALFVCLRAGRLLAAEAAPAARFERLLDLAVVLVAAAAGSLVFAAMAGAQASRLALLMLMLATAVLGIAHATALWRPWAGAMQAVAIAVPTAAALLLFWGGWSGAIGGVTITVYAGVVMVLAWRMHAQQLALAATRDDLHSERSRLATALASMPFALIIVDHRFMPMVWNPRGLEVLGLEAMPEDGNVITMLADAPSLGNDLPAERQEFAVRAEQFAAAGQPFELVLRRSGGRVLDIEAQPTAEGGWVLVMRDTTGDHATMAALTREARRCPLTGLANRRALLEELDAWQAAGTPFALLLADMDAFKKINERHGHLMGDRVLQAVGVRLRTAAPDLFVARLGGDEFAILAPAADDAAAMAVAARLGAQSGWALRLDDILIPFGLAIGVACGPRDGITGPGLMRAADLALIDAKQRQPAAAVMFEPRLRDAAEARNTAEIRVAAAIRSSAIDAAYQPIVDLAAGRVTGFEALARWRDDGRGVIGTDMMIAIAEQRGLITDLRRTMLREAARVTMGLDPALSLYVNISALDIVTPGFAAELGDSLAAAGLAADRLVIEVTETALMTHEDLSIAALGQVRAMGVRVAMDDFGTGFSSLVRLRRLPIDILKISGALISGAAGDASAASIFTAAAGLGQTIGIDMIAEGIEQPSDLHLAHAAGIRRLQGYLFAAPTAAGQLADVIAGIDAGLPALLSGLPRIAVDYRRSVTSAA